MALCERLRVLVAETDARVVACDVGGLDGDLAAVELLARLRLTAQRLGCRVQLRGASPALVALVTFCGLAEALPLDALRAGRVRQPEQREQTGGVEERVEPGDPPA